MSLRVNEVQSFPPDGFAALLADSIQQDFHMLERLSKDWQRGTNCFDQPGEQLFTCHLADQLVGIGGLNIDPYLDDMNKGRVRHVYVHAAYRRCGAGRALMAEIIDAARASFSQLNLRTFNPDAAAFYKALGFEAASESDTASHCIRFRNVSDGN